MQNSIVNVERTERGGRPGWQFQEAELSYIQDHVWCHIKGICVIFFSWCWQQISVPSVLHFTPDTVLVGFRSLCLAMPVGEQISILHTRDRLCLIISEDGEYQGFSLYLNPKWLSSVREGLGERKCQPEHSRCRIRTRPGYLENSTPECRQDQPGHRMWVTPRKTLQTHNSRSLGV